jgi:hypothetical protein
MTAFGMWSGSFCFLQQTSGFLKNHPESGPTRPLGFEGPLLAASQNSRIRSELPLPADAVEKQTFANAEIAVPNRARTPFLSGFSRLLRCRKDLG